MIEYNKLIYVCDPFDIGDSTENSWKQNEILFKKNNKKRRKQQQQKSILKKANRKQYNIRCSHIEQFIHKKGKEKKIHMQSLKGNKITCDG